MMNNSLYVIKVGSETVYNTDSKIFSEIKELIKNDKKVILVSGGAKSIQDYYAKNQLEECFVKLNKNGDSVRFSDEGDILNIRNSYEDGVLKILKEIFSEYKVYGQTGDFNRVIKGQMGKPLKINEDGKVKILRGSHYGSISSIDNDYLLKLMENHDIVILSPPVYEDSLKTLINVDADMLAAHIATALDAAHLRFVTSAPGILTDISDFSSVITDIYLDTSLDGVKGRMKQKVRAAMFALSNGYCDVKICGNNSLFSTSSQFWRFRNNDFHQELKKVINIPSVSQDERVLNNYLLKNYSDKFDCSYIDDAGNIVFEKGQGESTVLLLGHVDTVPYYWIPDNTNVSIHARGSVDAKTSYFNFLNVATKVNPPEGVKLIVIGAVEEEVSSSKGAFYVRDNYNADYVIIGEPSGCNALTLGYYGLTKLKIIRKKPREHSAAKGSIGIIEMSIDYLNKLNYFIKEQDKNSLSTILKIDKLKDNNLDIVESIINIRTSTVAPHNLIQIIEEFNEQFRDLEMVILRSTKGYLCKRSNDLVKSFNSGFLESGIENYKYLNKKGTSDMNTLATKWTVPIVAYGPGDSALDHTENEVISLDEFDKANRVLIKTLESLFSRMVN